MPHHPEKISIALHNGISRTLLRMAAFTVPYWGLFSSIVVLQVLCLMLTGHFSDHPDWTSYWGFLLLGTTVTTITLANRITFSCGKMRFPPYPYFSLAVSPDQIQSIGLTSGSAERGYRALRLTLRTGKSITINLNGLSGGRLPKLLRILENAAPNCQFEPGIESKAFCSTRHSGHNGSEKWIEMPYRSHAKLHDFRLLLLAHEAYFWRTWLGFWAVATAALSPLIALSTLSDLSGGSTSQTSEVHALSTGYNRVFSCLSDFARGPITTYYDATSNPTGSSALILAALVGIILMMRFLWQPNRLRLTSKSLDLRLSVMGLTWSNALVQWQVLAAITLIKPSPGAPPQNWLIGLKKTNGKLTRLKFAALTSEHNRRVFLEHINRYAAHVAIDPELITALSPAQKRSYTELWLQSLATPPKRNNLSALAAGQCLHDGRYQVIEQIGVGGQGVAYLASDVTKSQDRQTDSTSKNQQGIVLKEFVFPVYVDKQIRHQALQRFENEARMLLNLDHPQIVQMKDYFVEDHRGYLVLEHIDGFSLRQIVDRSEASQLYPEEWVVDLALQMCTILAYLHGLSPPIVHRDFTPDNLILNSSGTLKLIDFNVAQQQESTKTGTVVGKHAYLPPEQFRGKPTVQSDIYAMGATIFFLLAMNDPEPLTVASPESARVGLSPLLNEIVEHCTQLDGSRRYSSVSEIKDQLLLLQSQLQTARCHHEQISPSGSPSQASPETILTKAAPKEKIKRA